MALGVRWGVGSCEMTRSMSLSAASELLLTTTDTVSEVIRTAVLPAARIGRKERKPADPGTDHAHASAVQNRSRTQRLGAGSHWFERDIELDAGLAAGCSAPLDAWG